MSCDLDGVSCIALELRPREACSLCVGLLEPRQQWSGAGRDRQVGRSMRTLLIVLTLSCAGQFALAQGASQGLLNKLQECQDLLNLSTFDSIRPVFPLDGDVSEAMLAARTSATPGQRDALRAYRSIYIACQRKATEELEHTAVSQRAKGGEELKLELLITGKMTFADYALLRKVDADRNEFWLNQYKQATAPKPVVALACTLETGDARGLEIAVQFNESTQQVWASRGEAISRSWVNQTSVGYQQGKSTFSISRLTGRMNWTGDGVGLLSSGQCQMVTTQKF